MRFKGLAPVTAILSIGLLAVFLPPTTFAAPPADLQTQSHKALSQIEAPTSQPPRNVRGADTTIVLNSTSLVFTTSSASGPSNPAATTVQVSAPGAWSATSMTSWLEIHCATGNCGSSFFIVVPSRFSTFAPGTYDGSVTITSGNASHILPVAFTIGETVAQTTSPGQTAAIPPTQTTSAAITIDSTITYQTIAGFGTSERLFDDPHLTETFNPATGRSAVTMSRAQQDEILDKLYVDLGLTRVRPINSDKIEAVNDNSDPNVTDLTKFDFSWKRLNDHCDYIKRAQARGVTTAFLSPPGRESWMGTQTAADVAEYAEWLLAQVNRCDALGVRLPFISISNEPSYVRNSMSAAFVRDVIKELGPRLRAAGYSTMFVVPDDIRSSNAAQVTSVILADPVARSYVGALATHLYDEPLSNIGQMRALSAQYGIPLWMTEFSVSALPTASLAGDALGWASLMQELIGTYDVSAIDYMWGFFGQYDPAQLISIKHQGNAYTGYEMRKEYYVTGQFSRFIKPGALRLGVTSNDTSLKITAFKNGTELIIVIVNSGAVSKSATIQLAGSMIPAAMQPTFTALRGLQNWQTLPAIGVTDQTFNATLPGTSITTFISRQ